MKVIFGIVGLLVLGLVVFIAWTPSDAPKDIEGLIPNSENGFVADEGKKAMVDDGSYSVALDQSSVRWAGKKPLIEGYINSGSLALTDGNIELLEGDVSGMFGIDMNSLSVSGTPTKPGKESVLESHLKGSGWFDVETYPTAAFEIIKATPTESVSTDFTYEVLGTLTMKGQTHEIIFPAVVYKGGDGRLHALADFEFDRTKWGITAGSGSFFDDLADNAVDDMVALSFELVAEKQ